MLALALVPVAAFALSACSPAGAGTDGKDGGGPQVVASTNVYGDIAAAIAGDHADVTSIITSAAQDPHSFEASASDQLVLSKADIVIENGGGYDPFVDTLLEAADSDPVVLNVSELSGLMPEHEDEHAGEAGEGDGESGGHDHEHIEGFNEHVWYSFAAVGALATSLADELSAIDPDNADAYASNAEAFTGRLDDLTAQADDLAGTAGGDKVLVTEPVPLYLLEASGLENATPGEFSEAIEEGTDVSPTVLNEVVGLVSSGDVALLAYNEQTSGPETEQVRAAAESAGVPVVSFTETLPDGDDYIGWMSDNLDALAQALAR